MPRSAYERGYDDGYEGRPRQTGESLRRLQSASGLGGESDYAEYVRGYDEGARDAARDWTA